VTDFDVDLEMLSTSELRCLGIYLGRHYAGVVTSEEILTAAERLIDASLRQVRPTISLDQREDMIRERLLLG
jgi:hypothetical protein